MSLSHYDSYLDAGGSPQDRPEEVTPAPVPAELTDALDAFAKEARADLSNDYRYPSSYMIAARSSLESLYREQAEKLKESDQTIKAMNAEAGRLEDELSALRSLQLTPEEARIIMSRLTNDGGTQIPRAVLWDAMEKLRKISKVTP